MKIYLASTSFDDVRWASACGLLDGIAVAPPAGDEPELTTTAARALEIVRVFACPVLVSPAERDVDVLYREGRDLARETDDVTIEYPVSVETMEGLHRGASEGLAVAAGEIGTTAQALVAARAGASAVIIDLPSLEAQGRDAVAILSEIRRVFEVQQLECEVIARGAGNARQVAACAAAGADALIIDPAVLRDVLTRSTDRFDATASIGAVRRPRPV